MDHCTAGLDWASETHAICIVNGHGEVRESFEVRHDAVGLSELVRRLGRYPELRLAIERPDGLLVDTLVDAGIPVVPIHPNKLKAARERYTSSGAKSDPGDAYVLADLLRTDGHRFRELAPLSEATRALRALVRSRDDLVKARVALTNQLAASSRRSGQGRPRSSSVWTRRSRSPSSSAIPPPSPRRPWVSGAWRPSCGATRTAVGVRSPSCSRGCAPRRLGRSARWRVKRVASA